MINPVSWIVSKYRDWQFRRAFRLAPVKKLGNLYVKDVLGNLYAVDVEEVTPK